MLVLTRKRNETVDIPELGVQFKVLEVHSSYVRIGVTAPTEFRILRGELVERSTDIVGTDDVRVPIGHGSCVPIVPAED